MLRGYPRHLQGSSKSILIFVLNLNNVFYGCVYYIDGVAPQPAEPEGFEPSLPYGTRILAGFPLYHLSKTPETSAFIYRLSFHK